MTLQFFIIVGFIVLGCAFLVLCITTAATRRPLPPSPFSGGDVAEQVDAASIKRDGACDAGICHSLPHAGARPAVASTFQRQVPTGSQGGSGNAVTPQCPAASGASVLAVENFGGKGKEPNAATDLQDRIENTTL